MLKIGENLGHYKVQSVIGAGGMGEIYRARDTRLRRDVALKILPENLIQSDSAIERFMREAHAASALNHPNILTIFDIGEHDNIHFIATEFVEGQTLRQKMQKTSVSLAETLDIAVQVANALVAAHEAGIVHRDVKPENIMIRSDGYVKVLDFGIAKLVEMRNAEAENLMQSPHKNPQSEIRIPHSTIPGMIIGTASYMSPEQARGLTVDGRSDIFSLGVMIYETIAGRLPFSGATVSDIIAAILKVDPKPISDFVKNAPSDLELIVAKSLEKDLEKRYQAMTDFMSDLKRIRQRLEFEIELQRIHDSNEGLSVTTKILPSEHPTQILSKTRISTRKTRTRKAIDSLAVLPFVNGDAGAETEYLSDGITECIINSLSKLPKLRVVPRSTVFRYKGRETDLQEIGRELGVRAIFAGRIVKIGDSIVVRTELVDVANEAQIWGDQYRREMGDIFTLLDDIAEDISENLKLKLTGEEKKKLAQRYTENTEAYQFYLKGRYFVTSKRTESWIKKGIGYFQKAIDLDPNYALAHSGLAEAYCFLGSSTGGWAPRKAYPKAKAALFKALELDDALAEAHSTMGFAHLLYDWNFAEAERQFKRALQLSPNYPNAHDGYGFYLKAVGRHDEAIRKCLIAQQLDPLSPFAHVSLGYAYYFARDYDKAIEECNKALELDKYSTFAYRNLGLAFLQQGKLENAITALNKAVTVSNGVSAFDSYLGFAYARAGERAKAIETLENLREIAKRQYVPAYNFAMIYLGLGDSDKTFESLEKAFDERSGFMPFLKVEPMFDLARNDSRFENLLRNIGFNPSQYRER
ncbi:MAG TPA: protein kinase [Pyrinomonadaceae bacterium]